MIPLRKALLEGKRLLASAGSEEAELEAEILLIHALRIDRARLYQNLGVTISEAESDEYRWLLERRFAHEPTAYITGKREFFGLEFEVTPAALIPRPETETLMELVLAFVRECYVDKPLTIVDVGSGSGAIAVALAHELPAAQVVATDASAGALALARRNAERHCVGTRIEFREGDLLAPVSERVEVIVANLPYVTTAQWEAMPPEIREHEPRLALDGGRDGLDVIRRLLSPDAVAPSPVRERRARSAREALVGGGALFCEIGDWQGDPVRELAGAAFPGAWALVHPDLAGRDRVVAVYTAQA